jgi:hypothetical protein
MDSKTCLKKSPDFLGRKVLTSDQVPEFGTLQVGGIYHQPTLVIDAAGKATGFEKLGNGDGPSQPVIIKAKLS